MTIPADIRFQQIDDSDDLKREFWCIGGNAIARMSRAANVDQNAMGLAYNAGALAAWASVLGLAAPQGLRPDGSETNKP